MAEALKDMFAAGIAQATAEAKTAGSESATVATNAMEFKRETDSLRAQNPWIDADKTGITGQAVYGYALRLMSERGIVDGNGNFVGSIADAVKCSREAVDAAKKIYRIDEPKIDLDAEREKARKEGYDAGIKAISKKLNLTAEPVTLGDARNAGPTDLYNKFDEIEKLNGIDYEEAVAALTPSEREAFIQRGT